MAAENERDRFNDALAKLRRSSHLWRLDYQKETARKFQQLIAEVRRSSTLVIALCSGVVLTISLYGWLCGWVGVSARAHRY